MDKQEIQNESIATQEWEDINLDEVRTALAKANKWKCPGIDKIPNFWLNVLTETHVEMAQQYNDMMKHPNKCPKWLVQGWTYLLPKSDETQNPKNYRPITCLTTTYKILTSILTERTYNFLDCNNLLPNEQKGCKRGSYGCKDLLLVDKMIFENCKKKSRNLSTAWIDYKKAFDSVPHAWIIKSLQIHKVSPFLINFLSTSMHKWNTKLLLNHSKGQITSNDININSGIFQGDSLSPLLFCLSLIPLSKMLNDCHYGYNIL